MIPTKPVSEWGLVPSEVRAVRAVLEQGCTKGAARHLGLSAKTIYAHMMKAIEKSGAGRGTVGRLHMLLAFDRARRHEGGAA
jgi:transposase-like protein